MAKITVCDICGGVIHYYDRDNQRYELYDGGEEQDLCSSCYDKLEKFILNTRKENQ